MDPQDSKDSLGSTNSSVTTCTDESDTSIVTDSTCSTSSSSASSATLEAIYERATAELENTGADASLEMEPHLLYPTCELMDNSDEAMSIGDQAPPVLLTYRQTQQLLQNDMETALLEIRQMNTDPQMDVQVAGSSSDQSSTMEPLQRREEEVVMCQRAGCCNAAIGPFCSVACSGAADRQENPDNEKGQK